MFLNVSVYVALVSIRDLLQKHYLTNPILLNGSVHKSLCKHHMFFENLFKICA